MAARHGFGGVEFRPGDIAGIIEQQGVEAAQTVFGIAGVRPAGFGLPVDWRGDEAKWRDGLEQLPRQAKAAAAIGCARCMTWILPSSDDREYAENRRFHVERFTPIAAILAEHGCHLGLEFIGPKTLRDARKHPFIYKMEDMLEMGAEIGPKVGLLLDCWHWYTSGATVAQLRALKPEQVVYVHVSDAPTGIPIDQQIDNVRALPGETGVIDIAGFLGALRQIGYDGPITPEPFKADLRELPSDDDRLRVVGAAMDKIMALGGVA